MECKSNVTRINEWQPGNDERTSLLQMADEMIQYAAHVRSSHLHSAKQHARLVWSEWIPHATAYLHHIYTRRLDTFRELHRSLGGLSAADRTRTGESNTVKQHNKHYRA